MHVSWPHILRQTGRGSRGCAIFVLTNSPVGYASSPCKPRLTTNGFCFTQAIVTRTLCPRGTAVYLPVTFSISLCPGRQKSYARHGLPETSLLLFDKHGCFLLFKRAGIQAPKVRWGWPLAHKRQAQGTLSLAHCGHLKGPL